MSKRRRRAARAKNPRSEPSSRADVERAAQLFRAFREEEPGHVSRVRVRVPRAAMVVGELEYVGYRMSEGGKAERYMHRFRRGARPLLIASDDGKQLLIVGGQFTFSGRGIVDG